MFKFGFEKYIIFIMVSSKQTSTLTLIKISISCYKCNTIIPIFHNIGLYITKGSLLSFPCYCTKKMDPTILDPPTLTHLNINTEEIEVLCKTLEVSLLQRKCKHLYIYLIMTHPQAPWWTQLWVQRWIQQKVKELGRVPWFVTLWG
jgi:hypothetical protein